MDQEIFAKYGSQSLPRYTSYPTAPHFRKSAGPDRQQDWLSRIEPNTAVSLYLHVPFCRSMCWYCGCHTKVSRKDAPILSYLEALKQEIRLVGEHVGFKAKVGHIHFGGGTPTIIQPEQFLELSDLMRQCFDLNHDAEIAVEIDPRTLNGEMIAAMADAGVNRASLGVQSFDRRVQEAINRIQSEEQTADAVTDLRKAGISAINFDLIYGLPNQTLSSCIDTAKRATDMRPNRISVFGYAHVPGFKKHQRLIPERLLPAETERFEQAEAIAEQLLKDGYEQIGLDHFALPEDQLALASKSGELHRNFQGYTTDACQTLIGLGASSISRFEQGYVQNEVSIPGYQKRLMSGTLAPAREYELSGEDRMRACIIERLMCDFAVDLDEICSGFGWKSEDLIEGNFRLAELQEDGLVSLQDGRLRLKSNARFLIRAVAAAFDVYLDQSTRTFSKVA